MPKPDDTTDEWTIYNCHIHTFTKKHSPSQFWWWVISDGSLGKVNWIMIPVYVVLVYLYFRLLILLTETAFALSAGSNAWAQWGYPLVLMGMLIVAIPLFLLAALILMLVGILLLQVVIFLLSKVRLISQSTRANRQLMDLKTRVVESRKRVIQSNWLYDVLVWINPFPNDIFERLARFLKIAEQPTQLAVFREVELQYPEDRTMFVVLPMDMGFMDMGELAIPIEKQHEELLEMAQGSGGKIIPFYAADPRHPDIVERVKRSLGPNKFRGIKIYPNLGYKPNDPKLMQIYKHCIEEGFPVLTHCSPGGIWRYGVSRKERRANSEPGNYRDILETPGYRELKLCLAHFGGAEEWAKHLKGRVQQPEEEPWVRTIYDMLTSGRYPYLYADISYTVFTPKVSGLEADLIDYLKVLLSHPRVRERVLFGSDYYMVEQESVSEKEASLLLRSRLGDELYKQIAHFNPRRFLGIDDPAPKKARKKKSTPPARARKLAAR
jgi:predicted TIM-barrel fold metal-dependent hydrolase